MPFSSFRFHQASAHRRLSGGGVGAGIPALTMYDHSSSTSNASPHHLTEDDGTGHCYSIRVVDQTGANSATVIDKMSTADLSVVQTWTAPLQNVTSGSYGFKGISIHYSQTTGYIYFGGAMYEPTNAYWYIYLGAFDPVTGNMVWENYNPNQNPAAYVPEIWERNGELHVWAYSVAPIYSTHDLNTGAFNQQVQLVSTCNVHSSNNYDSVNNIYSVSRNTMATKGAGYNGFYNINLTTNTYEIMYVSSFTPSGVSSSYGFFHTNGIDIGNDELLIAYHMTFDQPDQLAIATWNRTTNAITLLHTITFNTHVFGTSSTSNIIGLMRLEQTPNGYICIWHGNGSVSYPAQAIWSGVYVEFDLTGTVHRSGLFKNLNKVQGSLNPIFQQRPKVYANGQVILDTGYNSVGDYDGIFSIPADDSIPVLTEPSGTYEIETGVATSMTAWSQQYTPVTSSLTGSISSTTGSNLWGTQGTSANGPNVVNTTAPFKFGWTLQPSSVNTTGFEAIPLT